METLLGYAATYAMHRGVSAGYVVQLEIAARGLERFVGHPISLAELSSDQVNAWLVSQQQSGLAAPTIHGKRRCIVTLWTAAHDAGLAPPVGRIRRIKCPELIPVGFLPGELSAMIRVAESLTGNVGRKVKIPRRLWWPSFLMASYDTALRLSDVLSLERSWIWPGGYLSIAQGKTGHTHRVQLRPSTLEAIDACMASQPDRRLIWPLWCNRNRWYPLFHAIRIAAGVETKKATKGIRILSASAVERSQPGCGSAHLGHRSPQLFERHYKDSRICGQQTTMPPALG